MIARRASIWAHRAFSVRGVYTPPGGGGDVEVRVIVDLAVDRMSISSGNTFLHHRDEADFLASEVSPVEGGTLKVHSATYQIGAVVEDDGHIIRVVIKRPNP